MTLTDRDEFIRLLRNNPSVKENKNAFRNENEPNSLFFLPNNLFISCLEDAIIFMTEDKYGNIHTGLKIVSGGKAFDRLPKDIQEFMIWNMDLFV